MSDEAQRLAEDEVEALLAARDEALAAGAAAEASGLTHAIPAELRGRLEVLQRLNRLRGHSSAGVPTRSTMAMAASAAGDAPLTRVGPYEVHGELGHGAFGVVYRATDPRVGREVAIKVPHPHVLVSPELRQRFHQEARAAAALDHPNVVPVYECNEAGPICYIVSAYCAGPTLARWLAERTNPVPPREAAALLLKLAEAVQHAHERGLLHRDLKPANVLLSAACGLAGPAEAGTAKPQAARDLVPRITDFGLAKFFDPPPGQPAALQTQTGMLLGTPSYMAPEQALADKHPVGPTADVYALGAILYELLTRRPPFLGDSALETLMLVRQGDLVPLRRLRPGVPRDLETVCHKCLAREPARRYASAAALGEDLRRFLEGLPVVARPAGAVERLWRRARRKPLVAGLTAALLLVFVLGFAGTFWGWRQAEAHAEQVRRERDVADTHFQQARQAVEGMSTLGERLLRQPNQRKTGREVLERVLGYYRNFLAQKSDDPAVGFDAAVAWGRVARIRALLDEVPQADEAFQESLTLLDQLAARFPGERKYSAELARRSLEHANMLRTKNRREQSLAAYTRAIALFDELAASGEDRAWHQVLLANTLLNRTSVLRHLGQAEVATRDLHRAVDLLRQALETAPRNPFFRSELAVGLQSLGRQLWGADRRVEAEDHCRQALAIRKDLHDENYRPDENPRYLALSYQFVAGIEASTGRQADAIAHLLEAIALMKPLMKEDGGVPMHRDDLSEMWVDLGRLREQGGRADEALAAYRQALQVGPESAFPCNRLAWWLATCADLRGRNPPQAVRLATRACDLEDDRPAYWNTLGVAHYRNGDLARAVDALHKAMQLNKGGDSGDWLFLALIYHRRGDATVARQWLDRASGWMDRNRPQDAELRRFRAEAEALLGSSRQ